MIKPQLKLLFRFSKYLYPYRRRYLIILLFTWISALVSPVSPYLTKLIIDGVMAKKDLGDLFLVLAAFAGVSVVSSLTLYAAMYFEKFVTLHLQFDLSKDAFSHIQRFSCKWFQEKTAGEHIYKISSDIDNVINYITDFPRQTISIIFRSALAAVMIFYLNWKLALIFFCIMPFFYLPIQRLIKKMRLIWEKFIANAQEILDNLSETFSHFLAIKAFGRENSVVRKYLAKLAERNDLEIKGVKLEYYNRFLFEWLDKITVGLVGILGLYWVTKGYVTLGTLTAVIFYARQLINQQSQLGNYLSEIIMGAYSCERIARLLDDDPGVRESQNAKKIKLARGDVVFSGVNFGYRQGQCIFKNMNFKIDDGAHVALVGPSGCGKSTAVLLILRLFDPTMGSIFIDGHNIKDISLKALKSQIGIALQEPLLWNDTIANNIAFALDDPSREAIEEAARLTGVDEFSKDLPNGLGTVIGENACRLSEGQKQKIAIAMALIKKPKILILDEAMSSMESASEEKIIRNIKGDHRTTTLITVSHRLSTVMKADYVYYLAGPDQMIVKKTQDIRENPNSLMFFAEQTSAIIHP